MLLRRLGYRSDAYGSDGGSHSHTLNDGSALKTLLEDNVEPKDQRALDEQEQDEVLAQLAALGKQSSILWRVASLILQVVALVVTSDLITSLPADDYARYTSTPTHRTLHPSSALLEALSRPRRLSLSLRSRISGVLRLPPTLALHHAGTPLSTSPSTNLKADLRISSPLLFALVSAGTRLLVAIYAHYRAPLQTGASAWNHMPSTAIAPFVVLVIAFFARSYADELDRDMDELVGLKYANKGA
ncbi:hypothetical protein EMMF5_004225 [Cystobasidiomycetes sp. EMM_F5]